MDWPNGCGQCHSTLWMTRPLGGSLVTTLVEERAAQAARLCSSNWKRSIYVRGMMSRQVCC
eukprot:896793-Amphidinium_carterae.1